jgi:hypothetical protein
VVKALETAVRLAPKDVESHVRLSQLFQTLGMAARAQRHLQLAQEISPNHPKLRALTKKGAQAAGGSKKGKAPAPPEGLAGMVDQLKDLWGRLTGKG